MIQDPARALANAEAALAPGGAIVIVDFGGLTGVPAPLRGAFGRWLETFHVRTEGLLASLPRADQYEVGPLGIYELARIERQPTARAG